MAGVLVDRIDRRRVMIFSDLGASLITLGLALLLMANRLEIWHICICLALCSMLGAFRTLAFTVSMSLLVPKQHFGRAFGMLQLAEATSLVIAPTLAGLLVVTMAMHNLLLIDFASFIFSLVLLLFIAIPQPHQTEEPAAHNRSLISEFTFGWRYIRVRSGLLGLLLLYACFNINTSAVQMLIQPLVLRLASPVVLGTVLSVAATGLLLGSAVMSAWGGPKPRIKGVLGFNLVQAVSIILAGFYLSLPVVAAAIFLISASFPMINSCSQAIWQAKVAPEVQGRVFATRRMLSMLFVPVAYLGTGPLADHVFEPLMDVNGALASSVGRVVGVGPNRGIGLLFMLLGIMMVMQVVAGYLHPRIRKVEDELPDAVPSELPVKAKEETLDVLISQPVFEHGETAQPSDT